jgi:hypothetical protein
MPMPIFSLVVPASTGISNNCFKNDSAESPNTHSVIPSAKLHNANIIHRKNSRLIKLIKKFLVGIKL